MKNLYKTDRKIFKLQEAIEEEVMKTSGEVTPEYDALCAELATLIETCSDEIVEGANYLKDAIILAKDRKEEMAALEKAYKRRLAQFKEAVINSMRNIEKQKIETPLTLITLPKRRLTVFVEDENKIPLEYMDVVPERHTVNKKRIEEAIRAGEEVPGATLAEAPQTVLIRNRK